MLKDTYMPRMVGICLLYTCTLYLMAPTIYSICFPAYCTIHSRIGIIRPVSKVNDVMFLSQTLTPVRQSVGAAPCRSTEDGSQA